MESEAFDPRRTTHIFASHQDPDVISSLALWLAFNPAMRCYTSWLWNTFIPHFGGTPETFVQVPDDGMSIELGGRDHGNAGGPGERSICAPHSRRSSARIGAARRRSADRADVY